MSQKSFKEFMLKYIEEMAKERKISKHEVNIKISNQRDHVLKTAGAHLSFSEFENFVEDTRKNVIQIFDGEFTKLTIKSLSKIKQIVTGSQNATFSFEDEEKNKIELQKAQSNVKFFTDLVEKLKLEKATEKANCEIKTEELVENNTTLGEKIGKLELNEQKQLSQIQSLEEQSKKSKDQLSEVTKDLNIKSKTLEDLVQQNMLKEDDLQLIATNMDAMLSSTEDQHKLELEEAVQSSKKDLEINHELEKKDFEKRLEKGKQNQSEIEDKIKVLEVKKEEVDEKNEEMNKNYMELKDSIDISSKTLNFIQSMLSTHPLYSAVMILANLGGELPLDTLAKSVGASPLRLSHLLEELVERELITMKGEENPMVKIIRDY